MFVVYLHLISLKELIFVTRGSNIKTQKSLSLIWILKYSRDQSTQLSQRILGLRKNNNNGRSIFHHPLTNLKCIYTLII